MDLPAFPQYKSDSGSTSQTKLERVFNSELKLNISTKDLTSEFTLEIAFGSVCLFLLTIITVLVIIIWLQRKQIRRLMRFFHGRPVPQHEDEHHLLNINDQDEFHDANQNVNNAANNPLENQNQDVNNAANNPAVNQDGNNVANNPHINQNVNNVANNQLAVQDQALINAVHNPEIVHQNQNVTQVVELIFPFRMPGIRNITALRTFHKGQREALREYQTHQARIFNGDIQN